MKFSRLIQWGTSSPRRSSHASGVEVLSWKTRGGPGTDIVLQPINSKGVASPVMISIPVEDLPAFIAELQKHA